MRRIWFFLTILIFVLFFFRKGFEPKRVYVADAETKVRVESILKANKYNFVFTTNRKRALVVEGDKLIVPPSGLVYVLDWKEEDKVKLGEKVKIFLRDFSISATMDRISTETILEIALKSYFEGKLDSVFENGYYKGPMFLFDGKGKFVGRFDPSTGKLSLEREQEVLE